MNSKLVTFQAKKEIREKLDYLAKLTSRSKSNWMRWIIEREYEQHSPTPDNGKDQERKD